MLNNNFISSGDCTLAKKAYNVENMGGKAMLLVMNEENFGDLYNYDDPMGKVEDIPTVIITKSSGDIIKDYITVRPQEKDNIHMVIKFGTVILI